jgi:hypothetical protein
MDLDFKLIILLVMLIGIVLFFTREFENLRKDFDDKIGTIVSVVDNNSKSIKGKIQTDMTTCVNKIKTHNMECIQQIRKMNTLGSQPITNMSNHCTDSDTDAQQTKKYNIKYLSDMRADVEKDKHEPSTYYVSEMSPLAHKHDAKEEKKTKNEDEFKIDMKTSVEQKSNQSNGVNKKKMDLIQSDLNKTKTVSQKEPNSIKSTPSLISQESDEKKESVELEQSENESSNDSSNDSSDEQTSDEQSSDNESDDESDEMSEDVSDDESVEVEIDRRALGKLSEKKYTKEPELVKEANDNEYESITVGSSKGNKKGVKPMMSVSRTKQVQTSESSIDEVSVQTHEIGNLTLEKLQEINKYKIDALKKIAKKYSIALTCKEGGGRRQLNKGELYNKIKEFLTDTHNIAS